MSAAVISRTDLAQRARQAPVRRVALLGLAARRGGRGRSRQWFARRSSRPYVVGLPRELRVLGGTGAGDGRLCRHAEAREGHWSGVLIRVAEAGAAFTAVSVVLFVGLFIGRDHIFTWLREPRPEIGGWLTTKWFFLRNGAVLVALAWLTWRFVGRDLAPDVRELATGEVVDRKEDADRIHARRGHPRAGVRLRYSLLGYDLVMSLAHKWVKQPVRRVLLHGELSRRLDDARHFRRDAAPGDGSG